jgi:hypothetical protein
MPAWLAWLLAIPALAVAALFGLFVFLAVLGLALVIALYFGVRIWWLKRRLRRAAGSEVLEAEYVVVRDSSRPDDRRLR